MIPFGKWQPDLYGLNAGVAGRARGVLPGANSKRPWPSMSPYSVPVGAEVRGAFFARKTDGNTAIYCGTEDSLLLYAGASDPWTDVSQSTYALPEGDRWSFAQFGNILIACNGNEHPQALNVDTGDPATDLGGSPPNARFVRIVGDQVWLYGLSDPTEVRWSGRNNAEFWEIGDRDCDFQIFPEGGAVLGVSSVEAGFVLQDSAIRRFAATTDRSIYNFAKVEDSRGILAPDSLIVRGGVCYFLSEEGFYGLSVNGSQPIGFEQVDNWFREHVDVPRISQVVGCADPLRNRVFWMIPTNSDGAALMNTCLAYDVQLQEWTSAQFDAYQLLPGATVGTTLDGLDSLGYTLDTLPVSLDSRQFIGGAPLLAGFDADQRLNFFTGANYAASIETAEFQAIPGRRAFVRGVAPITDAPNAETKLITRESLQANRSFGALSPVNAQGICPHRSSARYHSVRLDIPAGETWEHAQGVEVDAVQDGAR